MCNLYSSDANVRACTKCMIQELRYCVVHEETKRFLMLKIKWRHRDTVTTKSQLESN